MPDLRALVTRARQTGALHVCPLSVSEWGTYQALCAEAPLVSASLREYADEIADGIAGHSFADSARMARELANQIDAATPITEEGR